MSVRTFGNTVIERVLPVFIFWGVPWSVITYCESEDISPPKGTGEDPNKELPCGSHQKDTSATVPTDPRGDEKQSAKQPAKHVREK